MSFEPNLGQARPGVHYVARGAGYTVQLDSSGSLLTLRKGSGQLAMSFPGARMGTPAALEKLPGVANYFLGKDEKTWRRNIPTYGKLRYSAIYPGIDLVYYGSQNRLEYDFVVAPGADPSRVRLRFQGAGPAQLTAAGELQFGASGQTFRQQLPVAYQEQDGVRSQVEASYRILPGGDVAIALGAYDRTRRLVIDPTLSYASFLGGNNNDGILSLKVDATGSLYMAGFTSSANFKTAAPLQTSFGGRVTSDAFFGFGDAFIAKLNPAGTALVYCTYLGGSADDVATALAIDGAGNAYVAGSTQSVNFPVSSGAYQTRYGGGIADTFYSRGDAFLLKLNPSGDKILYSTYLGGSGNEMAWGLAVDATGSAVIVGDTNSTNLPTTANAISRSFRGGANIATNPSGDAFVARFNETGTALVYGSYLGGKSHDMARGVALGTGGAIYVAGGTYSSDFPTTPGAYQTKGGVVESSSSYDGAADDAWVMKINAAGMADYSTYLGGSYRDTAFSIAVDAGGNAYVAGRTRSTNFPTTAAALQTRYGGAGARGKGGIPGTAMPF
ncbi:SBBP repeat-containing protein [Bryobacter aggregatus]|uniref:DUF7948 domain-containing protein n=1 Tax=Bryobacter aggregatus TaxID=360054 RepID=UPI0009B5B32F|nr:SBBP repeat-containing protein [Bryobacter aggregatus]